MNSLENINSKKFVAISTSQMLLVRGGAKNIYLYTHIWNEPCPTKENPDQNCQYSKHYYGYVDKKTGAKVSTSTVDD